jgi:hypothetical protein
MGLLSNPVIAGLLSGGPNAVRAREQQRLAAMLPRGQGGMMGAPSGVVRQDSGLGAGLAGLGQGLAAIGDMRKEAQAKEAFEQTIASLPPEQQALARMNPQAYSTAAAQAMFRDEGSTEYLNIVNPRTQDARTIRKGEQIPDGYVMAGAASLAPEKPLGPQTSIAKARADLDAGRITEAQFNSLVAKETAMPGGEKKNQTFDNEKDLRGEVLNINKEFGKTASQFRRVEAAVKKPSPANDIALVFSYMKMLDPTSVVRENEQATAQNAGGVPQRIRAQWNALQSGENFTPEQRRDFYQSAVDLYGSQLTQYQKDLEYYSGLAVRNGLNPENIVRDISFKPAGVETVGSSAGRGIEVSAPPLRPEATNSPTSEASEGIRPGFNPATELQNMSQMGADDLNAYLQSLSDAELEAISTFRTGQ